MNFSTSVLYLSVCIYVAWSALVVQGALASSVTSYQLAGIPLKNNGYPDQILILFVWQSVPMLSNLLFTLASQHCSKSTLAQEALTGLRVRTGSQVQDST